MFGLEPMTLMVMFLGLILVVVQVYLMLSLYRKCPPNQAMIISGMYAGASENSYKIVVGGGAVVLPVIQQVNYLSLEMRKVQIKSEAPMLTSDGVPINFELTAQIKVQGDHVSIATAAECFLGKSTEEIEDLARNSILASIRSEVANMSVDRVKVGIDELVIASNAGLSKMGLTCVSMTVQNLTVQNERAMPILEP